MSISRAITRLADLAPERVVVTGADGVLTARDLDRRSNAFARAFVDLGVRRDDLVTVALPSSVEAVVVCCAVWKAGATPQPVTADADEAELAAVVRLARPALVVGRTADGSDAPVTCLPRGWVPPPGTGDGPLADVWSRSWKAPTSSGSTGSPKVVVAAAPALVDPSRPAAPFLPLDGVQLVVAPITGSAAFTYAFRGLVTGHALVLLPTPDLGARPDPRAVLAALVGHRVTWVQLSPAVLGDLVRLPRAERDAADLSTLRTVLHLGARCDEEVKREAIAWLGGPRVIEVYAGSESQGLTVIDGQEWLAHPGSVGRGAGGTQLRVRRPDGSPAAPGEVGVVWLRRPGAATYSYLGAVSRRDAAGWDTLGDLGRLDHDGYLHVLDRTGSTVVRGERVVACAEIEHLLERHPAVSGAAVRVTARGGLIATVDVTGTSVTREELLRWCVATDVDLAPTMLHLVDEAVRSTAGKVRRRSRG